LITVDKRLRQFFAALTGPLIEDIKAYFDGIWSGVDPEQTTDLRRWEYQFGLLNTGLTEQQRRDRLAAAWAATGGQSPSYIQGVLQANGFDVYVHDWWVPGTETAVGVPGRPVILNPNNFLSGRYLATAGNPAATAGNPAITAGSIYDPGGYALVNIVYQTTPDLLCEAGEPWMEAGEPLAVAGEYSGFVESVKSYTLPSDPVYFPYFIYIGGETFGTLADVPVGRRNEFEALCLKLCPCHLWLGMLINYV
jgi:hypothetical protein